MLVKNTASWCEARGQPRVKLLPLKEGAGFATVWGFVLYSDWSLDRWRVVTELIYGLRCWSGVSFNIHIPYNTPAWRLKKKEKGVINGTFHCR